MAPTVSNLLRVARSQLGYHETGGPHGDDGNITKYGAEYGIQGAWCAMFVWWCFKQLGIDLRTRVSAYFAGVVAAVAAWRSKGLFHTGVAGMRPGDNGYLDFPGEASVDHTVLVEFVDGNGVHTIEGNTTPGTAVSDPNGGGVYRRLRPAYQFVGYGRLPQTELRYDLKAAIRHAVRQAHGKAYPLLHVGDYGQSVTRLQTLLTTKGLYHGRTDGEFGSLTRDAVVAFQKANHLWPDGQAGPKTLGTLKF